MNTITIDRALVEQALKALEMSRRFVYADNRPQCDDAIDALRAALAQQAEPKGGGNLPPPLQAEPVAWYSVDQPLNYMTRCADGTEFINAVVMPAHAVSWAYTAPPQRKPLTEEEIDAATAQERDALLDHIYEYGTAAEGVLERIRKLCRAVERAHGIGEQP